jgi:hypothetical protein
MEDVRDVSLLPVEEKEDHEDQDAAPLLLLLLLPSSSSSTFPRRLARRCASVSTSMLKSRTSTTVPPS